MELRINHLPKDKFKYLSHLWTNLRLGSPHIVGLLFALITGKAYPTYNRWKQAYYESGKERRRLLFRFSERFYEMAVNPDHFSKKEISWPIYRINYFYGRTEEEVRHIAATLYTAVQRKSNPLDITLQDAVVFTEFMILGLPWNHELIRFSKTVARLNAKLPEPVKIQRARMSFVEKYAFQGLLMKNNKPAAGVYVKSPGWLELRNLLAEIREEIDSKLEQYKNRFRSEVYVLYSRVDGTIINAEEAEKLLGFVPERAR